MALIVTGKKLKCFLYSSKTILTIKLFSPYLGLMLPLSSGDSLSQNGWNEKLHTLFFWSHQKLSFELFFFFSWKSTRVRVEKSFGASIILGESWGQTFLGKVVKNGFLKMQKKILRKVENFLNTFFAWINFIIATFGF